MRSIGGTYTVSKLSNLNTTYPVMIKIDNEKSKRAIAITNHYITENK